MNLEKVILIRVKAKEEGINDNLRIIGRCCFSNVFYNKLKTSAAILLDYVTISHFGYGEIFLLEKKNNQWKVIKSQKTWVS